MVELVNYNFWALMTMSLGVQILIEGSNMIFHSLTLASYRGKC